MLHDEYKKNVSEVVVWNFQPYRPVYDRSVSEVVFVKKWQRLMIPKALEKAEGVSGAVTITVDRFEIQHGDVSFPIHDVLSAVNVPTEHQTRLAANFIHWLGCRSGQDFLNQAQRLMREKGLPADMAYVVQWDKENARNVMANDGLVPRDLLTAVPYNERKRATSVEDIEILEQTLRWTASVDGQAFIKSCEDNIALKLERERAARRAHFQVTAPGVFLK